MERLEYEKLDRVEDRMWFRLSGSYPECAMLGIDVDPQACVQTVGFQLIYVSYWNAMLFPLMVITRKLLPGTQNAASDVNLYPRPIDVLCRVATHIETILLRAGMRFPSVAR